MKEADRTELIVPEIEDSREICFEQGKPCVYEPDNEPGIIVTEWPNGIIDRWDEKTDTETRHCPDDTTETVPENTPAPCPDPHTRESPP